MCAPRPKLPDTFSVDDLVKKRGEGGAFGRVECATFRNKSARVKKKKKKNIYIYRGKKGEKSGERERESERATNRRVSTNARGRDIKVSRALSAFRDRGNMALGWIFRDFTSRCVAMHRDDR